MIIKKIIAGLTALAAAGYMTLPAYYGTSLSDIDTVSAYYISSQVEMEMYHYTYAYFRYNYDEYMNDDTNELEREIEMNTNSDSYKFTAPESKTYKFEWQFDDNYNNTFKPDFTLSFQNTDGKEISRCRNNASSCLLDLSAGQTVIMNISYDSENYWGSDYFDNEGRYMFYISEPKESENNTSPYLDTGVYSSDVPGVNQTVSGTLEKGSSVIYEFTAPVTSTYTFESDGYFDMYGYLYDKETMECIDEKDKKPYDAMEENFSMSCKLKKGQTVYLAVTSYNNCSGGSYSIKISKDNIYAFINSSGDTSHVGDNVTLSIESQEEDLEYQWYLRKNDGKEEILTDENGSTLSLILRAEMNNYSYYCVIRDRFGKFRYLYYYIDLQTSVEIVSKSSSVIESYVSSPVKLFVNAVSSSGKELKYQWQGSEYAFRDYSDLTGEGSTTDTIYVSKNGPESFRYYKCIITDEIGVSVETNPMSVHYYEADNYISPGSGRCEKTYYNYCGSDTFAYVADKSGKYRITVKNTNESDPFYAEDIMRPFRVFIDNTENPRAEIRKTIISDGAEYECDLNMRAGETAVIELGEYDYTDYVINTVVSVERIGDYEGTENITVTPASDFNFDRWNNTIKGYWGTDTNIVIPSEINGIPVKHIESSAFSEHREIESVVIPDSVESLGSFVFSGCSSLKSIDIPESVKSIGYYAFEETPWFAERLAEDHVLIINGILVCMSDVSESVTIPDGVTSIGDGAFENRIKLKEVIIPDSVTEIGNSAFSGCVYLENINIPRSVTKIGGDAFERTKWKKNKEKTDIYLVVNGILIGYDNSLRNIVIPESVKCIGSNAFSNDNLLTIDIPGRLENISSYAISYCKNLEKITVGGDIASFDENAIYGNDKLIVYGEQNTNTSEYCRKNNIPFTYKNEQICRSGSLGEGITWELDEKGTVTVKGTGEIPDFTEENAPFNKNYFVRRVVFEDGITDIGSYLFYGSTHLESAVLPSSLKTIGDYAFNGSIISSLIFPEGVTYVGENVFEGNSLLRLIIPPSVEYIGSMDGIRPDLSVYGNRGTYAQTLASEKRWTFRAFKITDDISWKFISEDSVLIYGKGDIPEDDRTFSCDISIKEVIISEGITSLSKYAFSECYGLEKVTLPSTITEISEGAFKFCSSLKKIVLSDNITKIGMDGFYSCSGLTEITLPESVVSIGESAFASCESLERIIIKNPECMICDYDHTISNYGHYSGAGPGDEGDEIKKNILFEGVIVGYTGSTAEAYADKYGYRFEAISDENEGVSFKSMNLALKDGITLNCRLEAGSNFAENSSGAYVHFMSYSIDKKVYFNDVMLSNNIYTLSIPVRPDRMTDEITATVYYSDGRKGGSVQFSVKKYLEQFLGDKTYGELAQAMLTYGARSQKYTGYRTIDLADEDEAFHGSRSVNIGSEYNSRVTATGSQVKAKFGTLELGGNTSVSVKFELQDLNDYRVSCREAVSGNNVRFETEIKGNILTVTIKNVRPQDLDNMYLFEVTGGNSKAEVSYGAFTYIKSMLGKNNISSELKGLLLALYDYNMAANYVADAGK